MILTYQPAFLHDHKKRWKDIEMLGFLKIIKNSNELGYCAMEDLCK